MLKHRGSGYYPRAALAAGLMFSAPFLSACEEPEVFANGGLSTEDAAILNEQRDQAIGVIAGSVLCQESQTDSVEDSEEPFLDADEKNVIDVYSYLDMIGNQIDSLSSKFATDGLFLVKAAENEIYYNLQEFNRSDGSMQDPVERVEEMIVVNPNSEYCKILSIKRSRTFVGDEAPDQVRWVIMSDDLNSGEELSVTRFGADEATKSNAGLNSQQIDDVRRALRILSDSSRFATALQ